MTGSPADGVRALAGPAAASAGLVLEDVVVTPVGRRRVVRVVVDLPEDQAGGVPMDRVAAASQALSEALDDSDVMGGSPYVLEVSSPGADRPLTERRHWSRARGRLVRVWLRDGRETSGRLTAVSDAGVTVADAVLDWDAVAKGRVELEFGRSDAAGGDLEGDLDGDLDDDLDGDLDDDPDDDPDDDLDGASLDGGPQPDRSREA